MSTSPAALRPEDRHDDTISFLDGLPGFESCRGFVVLTAPQLEPLQQLQCVDGPPASFLGIDPRRILPNYRCLLSQVDRERLGVTDESSLLWLALVAIREDGTVTANLRAPIVINPQTMRGRQVMPHRCLYALQHPVTDL